jgi:flagellin
MSVSIQLTSSMRANLVSLQQASKLMATTQERLSTGKRVNSVVDDAQSYFSARQSTDKADALSALKLDMGEGLEKVKTALTAIDSALDVLKQMKGLANQAKATSDSTTRSDLAAQFTELKAQFESILSKDANYKGTNLLAADNDLTIQFNEDNTSNLTINSVDTTSANAAVNGSTGYDPANAVGDWANDADITNALSDVTTAIKNLSSLSTKFASFSSFIQTRMDFTTSIVNINKEGSDNLTAADMNEESANMLTLQTRQSLATTALSLSNQAAQNVLKLF